MTFWYIVLIADRRAEIIDITERLLSYIDEGDFDNYLLVKWFMLFVVQHCISCSSYACVNQTVYFAVVVL